MQYSQFRCDLARLPIGAEAGIAVGAFVLLAWLVVGCYCYKKKKNQANRAQQLIVVNANGAAMGAIGAPAKVGMGSVDGSQAANDAL